MKLSRRKFLTWALALAAAAVVEVPRIDAWSQSARPIRVVLPFAPGGPADAMARLLAEQIGSAGGPTWWLRAVLAQEPRLQPNTCRARIPTATLS